MKNVSVRLIWEPRDFWIGVYWERVYEVYERGFDLYVCLVPMFPIRISWGRS